MPLATAEIVSLVLACAAVSAIVPAVIAIRQRRGLRLALAEAGTLGRQRQELSRRLQELEAAAKDRDRAEAASEAKSRFLATVSHEIRTPLSGVLGLADLLDATALTREQQSYVAAMKTSGEALMTLIDGILDFARIEAGRLDLVPEPFDVTALVEGVVELLAPRAHGKGLEIASYVRPDVPAWLMSDPNRLRQVLLNLAGNAVKFTERGGVGVAVGRRPDGSILFTISDTGPGVPEDRRAAIFDDFEQVDGSTTRRHGGAGLGLAITRRIVAGMGGELGVGDREGGGALFAFAVPLPCTDPVPHSRPTAETPAIQRCVIVSGEVFQAAYLAGALRDDGHEVVCCGSAVEAVALLRNSGSHVDKLFLDCSGGGDEARTVAAVARLAGVGATVLMFSPFERHALGPPLIAGFDAWLVKPIRRQSLAERLGHSRPSTRPVLSVARRADPSSVRVLLAEDSPVNALIARTSLERLGVEVVHAEDGTAALEALEAGLRARPFDLVLMDVCMPGLDGLEVTRRIRAAERRGGLRPAHIVATTAHALKQMREDCTAAGMDEVLTKPVAPTAFQRLVVEFARPTTHDAQLLSG